MPSKYANADGYGLGAQAVALAARYFNVPYVWGGQSPQGFDCSGLVQFVYNALGVKLPRTSQEQAKIGISVGSLADAQPGDLLIYSYHGPSDHVGIYAGAGQQIEAPHTGAVVRQDNVDTAHLTSIIRPFTGGSTGSAGSAAAGSTVTQAGDVATPADWTGGLVPALQKAAITVPIVLGGVVLVVVGLWRSNTAP